MDYVFCGGSGAAYITVNIWWLISYVTNGRKRRPPRQGTV